MDETKKPELKPLPEIAKAYGINGDYLRVLISRKRLNAVKDGRVWLTSDEWVRGYLRNAENWKQYLRTNGVPGARKKGEKTVFIQRDDNIPFTKIVSSTLESIAEETTPESFDLEFLGIESREVSAAYALENNNNNNNTSLTPLAQTASSSLLTTKTAVGLMPRLIGTSGNSNSPQKQADWIGLGLASFIIIAVLTLSAQVPNTLFVSLSHPKDFMAGIIGSLPLSHHESIIPKQSDIYRENTIHYPIDTGVAEEGDIISADIFSIYVHKAINTERIVGVAKTNSEALLLSKGTAGDSYKKTTGVLVVESRIAQVKVSAENGLIKLGDCIKLSSKAGVGARSSQSNDHVVGIALADQNLKNELLSVYVNPGNSNYSKQFCRINQ